MVKEAKLQINISYDFENKIKESADSLGMTKNEFVKFSIQNYILGLDMAQNAVNEAAKNYVKEVK